VRVLVFLPLVLFLILYVGTGIYFSLMGSDKAFYQLSPTVCILPSLFLGGFLGKRSFQSNFKSLIDGMRHPDIITMCLIFLLAGAFSKVTDSIGSVEATVQLALHVIPQEFLLIGVFLIASFISTSIGTSMGVVALITPIAIGLAQQGAFPLALGVATVVGGAMFGDNLSMISDTTIASVLSQEADYRKKFKLNSIIALISGCLTVAFLAFSHTCCLPIVPKTVTIHMLKVLPYVVLLVAGLSGLNVFIVLMIGLISAGLVGIYQDTYTLIDYAQDIYRGFTQMNEIMVLSLFIGGLSGLLRDHGATEIIFAKIAHVIRKGHAQRRAELMLAGLASLFDLIVANNTIAIILSGDMGRAIARQFHIEPHRSAYLLDTFSCVCQGIIPYGAQVLLASSLANLSPLALSGQVYYCYIIAVVALGDIMLKNRKKGLPAS
jgi:Na+/H+ antiporter NhaC